ncbi:MAG: amidohydrolase [Lachnospiraceae bacterium]|nr:amidohydrolase [Lachnospiraceae bacterium]
MNIEIKDAYALIDGKIERHSIYIEKDTITGVDKEPKGFKAEKTIDGSDRLVIPGLVNAHTHSYMASLRNIADDMPFMDWLLKGVDPVEQRMTGEDAYWGAMLAIAEMIRCGTTTFNDMQMHIHNTTRAVKETGMRAVICRGLVGDKYDREDRRIKEALEELTDGEGTNGRLTFRLGPHAPYSAGFDYLRGVVDIARERGLGIHIHLAESATEVENLKKDQGLTPIEYADKAGCFDVPCIAAHCVKVTPSDIALMARKNVSVVTNPASNMKLGNGFAPVPEMIEAGINVCLGTDGAASNNSLNMFHEMSLLTLIHKGTHDTPVCIGAGEAMEIATVNGARALGLEKVGAIKTGYKADLAILDINTPSMVPRNNMLSSLTYSANGSEVDTTIVDGEILMEGRELKTIDLEKVLFEANAMMDRLNGK